ADVPVGGPVLVLVDFRGPGRLVGLLPMASSDGPVARWLRIGFVPRVASPVATVGQMPPPVQARRIRIGVSPRGIRAILGPRTVRLRAGNLHQIATGLGQHNSRTACERYGDHSDA